MYVEHLKSVSSACNALMFFFFFSIILRSEALVKRNIYFFQINTKPFYGNYATILIQTTVFLTRSPTRQDGFQTRDKVFMTERRGKKNNLSRCAQLF